MCSSSDNTTTSCGGGGSLVGEVVEHNRKISASSFTHLTMITFEMLLARPRSRFSSRGHGCFTIEECTRSSFMNLTILAVVYVCAMINTPIYAHAGKNQSIVTILLSFSLSQNKQRAREPETAHSVSKESKKDYYIFTNGIDYITQDDTFHSDCLDLLRNDGSITDLFLYPPCLQLET